MIIRSIAAIVTIVAATGLARAQDEVPMLGIYEASCGPGYACTVMLSSGSGDGFPILTIRGIRTKGRTEIVCLVETETRPGTGVTTVGNAEIGGLVAKLQGVPVVVTGLGDVNNILVSAAAPICPVRGMPSGLTHLAVVGIYERQGD